MADRKTQKVYLDEMKSENNVSSKYIEIYHIRLLLTAACFALLFNTIPKSPFNIGRCGSSTDHSPSYLAKLSSISSFLAVDLIHRRLKYSSLSKFSAK